MAGRCSAKVMAGPGSDSQIKVLFSSCRSVFHPSVRSRYPGSRLDWWLV